jgi:hypothetical protein
MSEPILDRIAKVVGEGPLLRRARELRRKARYKLQEFLRR